MEKIKEVHFYDYQERSLLSEKIWQVVIAVNLDLK
jgi:hypothetical protein